MENKSKKLWLSKTFWVNLISLVAIVVQMIFGFVIDPEHQFMILGVVNTILRLVTKDAIDWKISIGS